MNKLDDMRSEGVAKLKPDQRIDTW